MNSWIINLCLTDWVFTDSQQRADVFSVLTSIELRQLIFSFQYGHSSYSLLFAQTSVPSMELMTLTIVTTAHTNTSWVVSAVVTQEEVMGRRYDLPWSGSWEWDRSQVEDGQWQWVNPNHCFCCVFTCCFVGFLVLLLLFYLQVEVTVKLRTWKPCPAVPVLTLAFS